MEDAVAVLIGATMANVAIGTDGTAEVDQMIRIDMKDVAVMIMGMRMIDIHVTVTIEWVAATEAEAATDATAVVTRSIAINAEVSTGMMTKVNGATAMNATKTPATRAMVVTNEAAARMVVAETEEVRVLGATTELGTTVTPVGTQGKVRITLPDRKVVKLPKIGDRVMRITSCSVRCCQTSKCAERIDVGYRNEAPEIDPGLESE